jgi:hypothetical protein
MEIGASPGLQVVLMDHPISPTATTNTSTTLQKVLTEIKEFTRQEPVAAVAAVCAVGLLVKLVPRSWVMGTVAIVGTALIKPALLSLGMTKAMELYLQRPPTRSGTAAIDS